MSFKKELKDLKSRGQAPEWYTEQGYATVCNGYLAEGETPKGAYKRISLSAAKSLRKLDLADIFFEALWKGWLCPSSPILSNLGTDRGLPISCYMLEMGDSIDSIFDAVREQAALSKNGGGVGIVMSGIRSRGTKINNNGESQGIIPWCKVVDSAGVAVSQGSTRRGAFSFNLNVRHADIHEFLRIRRAAGDIDRQCLNSNHCIQITDEFLESVESGEGEQGTKDRDLFREIVKTRAETGEPYIHFIDTTNRRRPKVYKDLGLKVKGTNICTEIMLHTDEEHTLVCDISSANLAKFDEWEEYQFDNGMHLIEVITWFLDGVMEEFLHKATKKKKLDKAIRSAKKGRPLGIGVLGWHTFLQSKGTPFTSTEATNYTHKIFKLIREKAFKASEDLAAQYGEPLWCKGSGRRNTHLMALAPTVSNSIISGGASPSIEPWTANMFSHDTAKGVFFVENAALTSLLKKYGKHTKEVRRSIREKEGSVQHLSFLTDRERATFKTFEEIDPVALLKQAAHRQEYLDQAQSINLKLPADLDPKFAKDLIFLSWRLGLDTLYYHKSSSVQKVESTYKQKVESDCGASCEG